MDKFAETSAMLDSGLRDLLSTWEEIVSNWLVLPWLNPD